VAQFQQNVAVDTILKKVFVLDHPAVFQDPVNLDFGLKLLSGA